MEKHPESAIVNIPNITTTTTAKPLDHEKRKSGAMRFHRVAFMIMRGRSAKQKVLPAHDYASKGFWRRLVGSMRPLHLQSARSPRAATVQSPSLTECGSCGSDFATEEEPNSPSPPSSRYASAEGLNELVKSEEENQNKEEDGDEMIDAKAEEFIAQFYQQMRLQRLNSMDRDFIERSNRSLGS